MNTMRGALACAVLVGATLSAVQQSGPPPTRVEEVVDRLHGVDVPDPYRWLEDEDSPATRAWIDAQNAYTRAVLDAVPERARLRRSLVVEWAGDTVWRNGPTVRGGRYFYERRQPGQSNSSIVVRQGLDGPERVLVDPKGLSTDGSARVSSRHVSADGRMLAYSWHRGGADQSDVHFIDTETGAARGEVLPGAIYYRVELLPDARGVLYTRRRTVETRLLEHRFGTPVETDRELFGAGVADSRYVPTVYSDDGQYVAAFVGDRLYLWDRARPEGATLVAQGVSDGVFGGQTLFLIDRERDARGRVVAVDPVHPSRAHWREVVPTPPAGTEISMVRAAGGKLLLRFRRQGFEELAVFGLDGKRLRDVPLPSLGAAYFLPITRWDSDEVFYYFSSVAHPSTAFRFNLATGERSVWSGSEEAGALDVISREVSYTSKDGTAVPLLVMMKRGVELDGNRMALLSAYGAYGNVRSPFFDPLAHAIIRQGGVYAFAGVRGGGELGTDWHRGGMLDKKQNSFDDLIAAAEWLIANRYTRASRLGIHGASAGGMLVAGAALQRPDLFGAVIAINGHFDMLRYHTFSQGAAFVPEFGNPDLAEDFAYLLRYSPYHQLRNGARYPPMLFMTGGADTRVAPLHSRKLAARLQAAVGSGGPIMLRYEMLGGHSRVDAGAEGVVDELAFLVSQLGEPAGAVAK